MNDLTLELFGPTIHTWWNSESSKSKDELINKLVGMFTEGTFNKLRVISKAVLCFKYLCDQSKVHLQKKPKYELPTPIPKKDWKALVEYAKDKMRRKEGKTPPGS